MIKVNKFENKVWVIVFKLIKMVDGFNKKENCFFVELEFLEVEYERFKL